jgi:mannose-6-phosphate isomerase
MTGRMVTRDTLIEHCSLFDNNLVGQILPYWASEEAVSDEGIFEERLDFNGRPIRSAPRRAMVQARQIFVFSDAAKTGQFTAGGELAGRATANLLKFYTEDGDASYGFRFSISETRQAVSNARDSYTHAFILFALASMYKLTGEQRLRLIIERTVGFVERCLVDTAHGGLYDSDATGSRAKRQNPLMHLLEAFLALHEAIPEGPYIEKAAALIELF